MHSGRTSLQEVFSLRDVTQASRVKPFSMALTNRVCCVLFTVTAAVCRRAICLSSARCRCGESRSFGNTQKCRLIPAKEFQQFWSVQDRARTKIRFIGQ